MRLKNLSEINVELSQIPRAIEMPVYVGTSPHQANATPQVKYQKDLKAIIVDGKTVAVMSDHYETVQHEDAFRPVLEGLAMRQVDYKYALFANHRRAWLNIYVGEGADTIRFGFRITNSLDGTTKVRYGLSEFQHTKVLELVGYRQVCSNGMIIKVNLENAEIVKLEEKEKFNALLEQHKSYRHSKGVNQKIEEVQYIVEAFLLMKNPLQRIVEKAKNINLELEKAKEIIEKYVGKRKLDKILTRYGFEEQTLWGLYNAATFVASHRDILKATKFNTELQKAATMLEQELSPVLEVK